MQTSALTTKPNGLAALRMLCCSLQIRTPDEYDIMFICSIRSERIYHPSGNSPSKSYAALRLLTPANWEPAQLLSRSNDRVFVCPKAFKQYFRQQVERTVNQRPPAGKEIGRAYVE